MFRAGRPAGSTGITDTNRLGGMIGRFVDIVPSVPLKNPLYSENCTIEATCEPYLNLAASAAGQGLAGQRPHPALCSDAEFFDVSIKELCLHLAEKAGASCNFAWTINLLNHPNFRWFSTGNTPPGFGSVPN